MKTQAEVFQTVEKYALEHGIDKADAIWIAEYANRQGFLEGMARAAEVQSKMTDMVVHAMMPKVGK
jgi:hypothetical protein